LDSAGLNILLRELAADCEVAGDAAQKAGQRARLDSPGHLEACAYELARFFNVLEKMLERICEAFARRQSRPWPRTHRGGQRLRSEALKAENA
jgi:hypothetical protein